LLAKFPGDPPDDKGNPVRGEFVAFSPYGRWLATLHKGELSLRLARTGARQTYWQPELGDSREMKAIRFDSRGNSVLAFIANKKDDGSKGLRFLRLDIQTLAENRFEGTCAATWGFALPGDKSIVTYNGSPEITVWDVDKRAEASTFKAAPEHVHDMQLAPSGDTIATVGDDNVVKFWDTTTWKQRETKLGYRHNGANVIKFSPDGQHLVTLSDDGWLKCWDAPDFAADRTPTVVRTNGEPTGVWTVHFSDGTIKQQFQNWTVRETRPDGTVEVCMQQ
jgi:WD40 repeat protein